MIEKVITQDGTKTAYSKDFDECYHSTKDGAVNESLTKHIKPAFLYSKEKNELNILDICFGLGYNTLLTLYYRDKYFPDKKINIYSPEFDAKLVKNLPGFEYPKMLKEYLPVLKELSLHQKFSNKNTYIELFLGDAREYITKFENFFDIVYQDPFSPKTNRFLWSYEYFKDIKTAIKQDGIITTYSTALKTRLALYSNGFNIYLLKEEGVRNFTLASLKELQDIQKVDMEHKIKCNPDAKPIYDT